MSNAPLVIAGLAAADFFGAYVLTKQDKEKIKGHKFTYYNKFPGYFQIFFGIIAPWRKLSRSTNQLRVK